MWIWESNVGYLKSKSWILTRACTLFLLSKIQRVRSKEICKSLSFLVVVWKLNSWHLGLNSCSTTLRKFLQISSLFLAPAIDSRWRSPLGLTVMSAISLDLTNLVTEKVYSVNSLYSHCQPARGTNNNKWDVYLPNCGGAFANYGDQTAASLS